MPHPRVSVVVPTFNRFEWLPTAIASVQAQTLESWELLIVDDGSTDETEDWARRLAEPRVRYVRREHSGNIAATRNAGVEAARGEWIAFLDSDDRWRPDKLARQFERLALAPDRPWCYGGYQLIDRFGRAVPKVAGGPWQPFDGWMAKFILTDEASVATPTLMVLAELAKELQFDRRLPLAEDYDFTLRLAARAPGCVVDGIVADVLVHEGRTTTISGRFSGHLGKAIAYRKAVKTLPDPALRRIARRQLRWHVQTIARRALRGGAPAEIVRAVRALWCV